MNLRLRDGERKARVRAIPTSQPLWSALSRVVLLQGHVSGRQFQRERYLHFCLQNRALRLDRRFVCGGHRNSTPLCAWRFAVAVLLKQCSSCVSPGRRCVDAEYFPSDTTFLHYMCLMAALSFQELFVYVGVSSLERQPKKDILPVTVKEKKRMHTQTFMA